MRGLPLPATVPACRGVIRLREGSGWVSVSVYCTGEALRLFITLCQSYQKGEQREPGDMGEKGRRG